MNETTCFPPRCSHNVNDREEWVMGAPIIDTDGAIMEVRDTELCTRCGLTREVGQGWRWWGREVVEWHE